MIFHFPRKTHYSKMGMDCFICRIHNRFFINIWYNSHCNSTMHHINRAVLYFLKWDYKEIFRKPSRRDIGLAVALFAGYIIYAVVVGKILEMFGIVSPGTVDTEAMTSMTLISSLFSIMGEEFIKFIPFMFFLRLLYKYTNNRKLSIVISVALIMVMFASLHAYNPIMLIFALFIQGFGSIFEFYGYVKTKNLLIPYLSHLLTDEFIFILILLGVPI